jgi:hypothetical protein
LNQVYDIRFDPVQLAEVFQPRQHDVDAVCIVGELASSIEQRLQ